MCTTQLFPSREDELQNKKIVIHPDFPIHRNLWSSSGPNNAGLRAMVIREATPPTLPDKLTELLEKLAEKEK